MDMMVFGILLFALQCMYWLIGRRASQQIEGNKDYFLSGRGVSFFPLMMTFLATQVGGGLVLGAADEAFRYGWSVLFYPLGVALGLIILGLGVGRKIAQFPVSTVAQILEVVYRSPLLKKIASLFSIISLFMILVGQIVGSYKFLLAIGFSNPFLFILFWTTVILYTVRGGLKAVISIDIAQAVLFSAIFLFCFAYIKYSSPVIAPVAFDSFALGSSKLTSWLLLPLLFMVIEQDMGQRCFAGKSPRVVSQATLCAGILTFLVVLVPVYLGVVGRALNIDVPPGASVLMTVIAQLTNPWVTAIVGCAVLAAIISTATSLINAISSNISQDFSFFEKRENPRVVQGITLGLSIGAIFFAFYCNNIVDVLLQSYELSVSCLFVPIFIALFKKRGYFLSGLFSIMAGLLGFFMFKFISIPFPTEIVSLALSLAGYGVGELIERLRSQEIEQTL